MSAEINNRSLDSQALLDLELRGFGRLEVAGQSTMHHENLKAVNDAMHPDRVAPQAAGTAMIRDGVLKVKLATGRELVGEVLQTNARRDVALVKTESAGAEPLAIRATEPNIGEDVYAIGSPYGERFSGTLTRGVLSGHRTLDTLRFLQSDVAVLPGNSGGPLLDADGRVVGIAVRALDAGRANLNLFIPIQEALDVLAVDIVP